MHMFQIIRNVRINDADRFLVVGVGALVIPRTAARGIERAAQNLSDLSAKLIEPNCSSTGKEDFSIIAWTINRLFN